MQLDQNTIASRTAVGRGLQLYLLLVAGLFLSACRERPTTESNVDPTGIYTLVSVDGLEVPANVLHGDVELVVRSGTFTISADGTCSSKTVFGPPSGDEMTREVNATYTQEGPNLTMQWEGAGITEGIVEGDSFTMDNEGMIFAYKKESAAR